MISNGSGEQGFRALVEAATDAILVIGSSGDILYANDAAGDLFRQTPATLHGAPFGYPVVLGQTVEVDLPAAEGVRIAEMRVSSVCWEGGPAAVAILRDVSERVTLTAYLRDRLHLEELMLDISAGFARATLADEEEVSGRALTRIAAYLHADHACLVVWQDDGDIRLTACHPGPPRAMTKVAFLPLLRAVVLSARGRIDPRPFERGREGEPNEAVQALLQRANMAWLGLLPLAAGHEEVGWLLVMRARPPDPDGVGSDLDVLRPVAAVLVDSLRRLRAEALLNDVLAKQAAVFQQAVEGLVLVRQGRILRANQAMAQMLGYPVDALVGMETRALFASDEGYDALEPPASLANGQVFTGEHLFQRRSGERFWVELKGVHVDTFSDPPDAVWVLRDISEQREERRRKEQLIDELRRSNAELERFAFITSHDLKEPVRMVASYVNLLSRRYGERLDEEGREFLAFALEGARRIHQMIEGILDYARIEKAGADVEAVSLMESVQRVQEDLKDSLRESGAHLDVDPLPSVLGVTSEIDRLFANLIGNAIKFAKPKEAPVIRITCVPEDEATWHLKVSDQGIGIPARDRERVFDLFWRLHARENFDGNGLGLAIVKRIVERRGGHIWLDSRENDGTTVHVLLPAVPGREA
ncbi:ATP-binding protein [Pararhodospirillum photometricum]|uniref:histidine kinase n=1 Tax=Pararhodospirillum photometricum DSM 122 TaxID=1150469 RepID=H6SP01_PARPM|nr:ATP-binding protein [Pararhodospirillum photometricum]CCG07073.1 Sensor protein [Pararhodospirillum photometricum DSM 122]